MVSITASSLCQIWKLKTRSQLDKMWPWIESVPVDHQRCATSSSCRLEWLHLLATLLSIKNGFVENWLVHHHLVDRKIIPHLHVFRKSSHASRPNHCAREGGNRLSRSAGSPKSIGGGNGIIEWDSSGILTRENSAHKVPIEIVVFDLDQLAYITCTFV